MSPRGGAGGREVFEVFMVSKECVYLKQLLFELAYPVHITVYCDSPAAIAMIKNTVLW